MKPEAFKIRFPDGTYSRGGSRPTKAPRGKVWASKGAFSGHITLATETWANRFPDTFPEPHPYEGAVVLDLVAGTEHPLDVEASVKKQLSKLEDLQRPDFYQDRIDRLKEYLNVRIT